MIASLLPSSSSTLFPRRTLSLHCLRLTTSLSPASYRPKTNSFVTLCSTADDANKEAVLPFEKIGFSFLLVDRVIEYNPGVSAVAIKNVTMNEIFFPGHFPGRPVMPGVLIIEAMAQVGAIFLLRQDEGGSRQRFFFAGIDKVRFRKPVVPGDTW